MLLKLIKYENKAMSRVLIPVYVFVLLVGVINRLSLDLCQRDSTIILIFDFLFSFTCLVAVVMFFIVCIHRFISNFVGSEGYLMFTLPTSTYNLVISKIICTIIWAIIGFADFIVALVIISLNKSDGLTFKLLFDAIKNTVDYLYYNLEQIGQNPRFVLTMTFIYIALYLLFFIIHIYTSIAIGTQFPRHKVIFGLVYYFSYFLIFNFIVFVGAYLVFDVPMSYSFGSNYYVIDTLEEVAFIYNPHLIGTIIVGNVIYIISFILEFIGINNIFQKKLNLE